MRTLTVLVCLTMTTTLLIGHAAAASQLDIKTGQWEMTSVIHMDGGLNIPPDALAHMPPDVRDRMQAMMQSFTKPRVTKSCITDEQLRRGFDMERKTAGYCHQTLANLSAGEMEVSAECQSHDGSSTMHAKFDAEDRTTLHGSVEVNRTSDKGPRHLTVQIDGKWLGDTCDGTEDDRAVPVGK